MTAATVHSAPAMVAGTRVEATWVANADDGPYHGALLLGSYAIWVSEAAYMTPRSAVNHALAHAEIIRHADLPPIPTREALHWENLARAGIIRG
jgi:hypothetical protein